MFMKLLIIMKFAICRRFISVIYVIYHFFFNFQFQFVIFVEILTEIVFNVE